MADAFADRAMKARDALKKRLRDRAEVDDDHVFSGFDAYQRLLDSGVDMAILAEPPHFRPIHIEACVEAGVHVFAEKPMAVDAPGVRRVLAAGEKARDKNVSFVSGFETRDSTSAREAIRRLRDGAIGEIMAIQGTYNVGPLWHRGRQPEWTEMEFQMRNWYYFTWLSGDHIVEQHVHFYDVVGWIMKEQPPRHAWGYGEGSPAPIRSTATSSTITRSTTSIPGGQRVYGFTRQQAGCFNEVSYLVLGTKGRLTHQARVWRISDLAGQPQLSIPKDGTSAEQTRSARCSLASSRANPSTTRLTMARSTMLAILAAWQLTVASGSHGTTHLPPIESWPPSVTPGTRTRPFCQTRMASTRCPFPA